MKITQFDIWIADLNPGFGEETGKTTPVVVVQTGLLNDYHPATLICPITTNVRPGATLLRVHLLKGESKKEHCDIMVDQIRAIENKKE